MFKKRTSFDWSKGDRKTLSMPKHNIPIVNMRHKYNMTWAKEKPRS